MELEWDDVPVVPTSVLTSPGMVVWFFSLTEQPKSPSLIGPVDVRKMLAPENKQTETISNRTKQEWRGILKCK